MKHLESGDLRRMLDEPEAFSTGEREHARSCAECRARAAALADDASFAATFLSGDPQPVPVIRTFERRGIGRWRPGYGAVAATLAAAFVVALFTATPLRGYGEALLTIFQPKTFQPIFVSRTDMQHFELPRIAKELGTQRVVLQSRHVRYPSLTAAAPHMQLPMPNVTQIAAQFDGSRRYSVSTPSEMTFTFSAAKASAYARRAHKRLPPMPSDVNGTTVRVDLSEIFSAHFEKKGTADDKHPPFVEVLEAQAPRVSTDRASLDVLERYLLAMPGTSAKFAAQLRALADPSQTLPIPVDVSKANAQQVTVDGVQGLAIGDNTGLGGGVVWQKDGVIYAVGGLVTMDQALAFANALR